MQTKNTDGNNSSFFKVDLASIPREGTPITFLANSTTVDYYVFRNMYLTKNFHFLHHKLIKTAGDFTEKLLKTYLLSFNESITPKDLSHRLEKIRQDCATIDPYFNKTELRVFCEQYSQASNKINGHQIFGYSDTTVFEGSNIDFEILKNLLDEIFIQTIFRMRAGNGLIYYNLFGIYVSDKLTIRMCSMSNENAEHVRYTFFSENNFIEDAYESIKHDLDNRYLHRK